ncbi:ankyrin repeat protein [Pedobacter sp. UYEF25]
MKKFLLLMSCCVGLMLHVSAQTNILLQQTFWQEHPSIDQVKAEIVKGADPTALNDRSFDPVVFAINSNAATDLIIYLLDKPGNSTLKLTHDGRTYLHWASVRGNTDVVALLLKKGADLHLKDSHGMSAFNFAASSGQQETKVYDLLLAKGENIKTDLNDEGANALLLAISNDKDLALTNYFISKGLSIQSKDAEGINAFGYAAKGGSLSNMKGLLKMGVLPDARSMVLATQGRSANSGLDVYQYLESLKLNPKAAMADGTNALHNLVKRQKQTEVINYFLEKGIDVNQLDGNGNTVFINAAAANSDVELLKTLQSKVQNINQQNKKGESALMLAVANNSAEIVDYLLANSADVALVNAEGNNLTYYLVEAYRRQQRGENSGKVSAAANFELKLALLKAKGFDLAGKSKNGNTMYHFAVMKGNLSLLKFLPSFNIDIDAKNEEGYTALHRAAMLSHNDEMMKFLISIGAKKDLKTSFDETAYDLAKENELLTKNHIELNFLK